MKNKRLRSGFFWWGITALAGMMLTGCASVVESKLSGFSANFAAAIKTNDDPKIVEQGMPSYLLLMDALIRNNPGQASVLAAAASLNSAYAGSFVPEPSRAALMNEKAMRYAFQALCLREKRLCDPRSLPVDNLKDAMEGFGKKDAVLLYAAASAWAGWIQSHGEDWGAVADLARVEALLQRVIALDDGYEQGMPHLYLGVLATVLTPALGGRPEEGKREFEKALALSGGKNLMAKVYYARQYARGVFDRELHDRLLQEVLATDPHAGDFTLSNMLALREAALLLKSADDYF